MTEQEKREKAIAEMAVIGCVRNPQAHTSEECEVCGFKEGMCNAYRHATKLYDYILHREEEVRRGTARKYSSVITDAVIKYLGVTSVWEASRLSLIDSTITYDVVLNTIEKLNEEFGVEVAE